MYETIKILQTNVKQQTNHDFFLKGVLIAFWNFFLNFFVVSHKISREDFFGVHNSKFWTFLDRHKFLSTPGRPYIFKKSPK